MAFATTVRDGACQADGRRQHVEVNFGFLCERDQTVRVKGARVHVQDALDGIGEDDQIALLT